MDWNLYSARVNSYGDTENEFARNLLKDSFETAIQNSANAFKITIGSTEFDCTIEENSDKDRTGDDKVAYFRYEDSIPDSFSFQWDGIYWVTLNRMYNVNQQYRYFYIKECNDVIKFLDNNDNVITKQVSVTRRNSSPNRNREVITTGSTISVIVQNDADTANITENYRFVIGNNKVFKVVGIDSYTNNASIFFDMEEVQKEDADDLINKIADNPYPDNQPIAPDDGMFIDGSDVVYYGFYADYDATLYENGSAKVPQPTINFSVDQPSYVTLNVVGNSVTVTPVEDLSYATKTLVLLATDGTNTYEKTIKISSI